MIRISRQRMTIAVLQKGEPMIQIEESNPSFESCSDCIYSDDSEETCIFRRCIHAVAQLNECYVPKQPPEIVRCNDCKHWTQTTGNMRGFGDGFESGWNAALENKGGDST